MVLLVHGTQTRFGVRIVAGGWVVSMSEEGLYRVLYRLGKLEREHEGMGDSDGAIRGIRESRNVVEAMLMEDDD